MDNQNDDYEFKPHKGELVSVQPIKASEVDSEPIYRFSRPSFMGRILGSSYSLVLAGFLAGVLVTAGAVAAINLSGPNVSTEAVPVISQSPAPMVSTSPKAEPSVASTIRVKRGAYQVVDKKAPAPAKKKTVKKAVRKPKIAVTNPPALEPVNPMFIRIIMGG